MGKMKVFVLVIIFLKRELVKESTQDTEATLQKPVWIIALQQDSNYPARPQSFIQVHQSDWGRVLTNTERSVITPFYYI